MSDFSGNVPGNNGGSIPATSLVSGIVNMNEEGFQINFTDYANACGHAKNNDTKPGSTTLSLKFQGIAMPSVKQYPTGNGGVTPMVLEVPAGASGACGAGAGSAGGSMDAGAVSGVNITAADDTHVAGSFEVAVNGSIVSGTFDVPVCSIDTSITPQCCVP